MSANAARARRLEAARPRPSRPRCPRRRQVPARARPGRDRDYGPRADARALEALNAISDSATMAALIAERAFLAQLEGSCRTPIAASPALEDGRLRLFGRSAAPRRFRALRDRRRGRACRRGATGARGRARSGRPPARRRAGEGGMRGSLGPFRKTKQIQAKPSPAKLNQAKVLGFTWFYSSESGLFNGLRRIQIRIFFSSPLRAVSVLVEIVIARSEATWRSRSLAARSMFPWIASLRSQ